jgi:hypothetical protein
MRGFHKHKFFFRRNREKPILTDDDIVQRFRFSKKYKGKSKAWWRAFVQLHVDCKWFKVFLNGKARLHAARERCWGSFRARGDGDGLKKPYVRHTKKLKFNTGARGVMVLAGVGKGKVLVWEYIKGKWNGEKAAKAFVGPVKTALRRAYPRKRKFQVLEDNDPGGLKTKVALKAKSDAGIIPFKIPNRSPQLNVLDYAIWARINQRMRKQELRWPVNKKETRQEYLARLRRTAKRLPPKFINKSIMNMKARCQRLFKAEGGQIEKGGL